MLVSPVICSFKLAMHKAIVTFVLATIVTVLGRVVMSVGVATFVFI